MQPVEENPIIPSPNPGPHTSYLTVVVQMLVRVFRQNGFRINRVLPKDGTEPMEAPLELMTYTVATEPTASEYEGAVIYVSDGAGGAKFRGSDGTSWVSLG